jgi:gamma-glutamyltranspeptidase/glutathione hydrolase
VVTLVALGAADGSPTLPPYSPDVPGRQAAVAAGSAGAVEAASQILRAGGNAVDAAIGAAFAATVCEPGLASLAGGGFLTVRAADGHEVVHDFFVNAPGLGRSGASAPSLDTVTIRFGGADQVFHAGLGSLATPGTLDGLLHAHDRHGRLGIADIVDPARRLAAEGWTVDATQHSVGVLLAEIFRLSDECWSLYSIDDEAPPVGSVLTNPQLAATLEAIAAGTVRSFADVDGVRELLDAVAAAGGALTSDDLAAYAPVERAPLRASHRGAVLSTNPAPSFGGPILAEATRLLGEQGPVAADAAGATRLIEALRGATEREKELRRRVPVAVKGTTHVSVVDGDGALASLTQSNGSSSGIMVPGSGVQMNNVMGEEDLHPAGLYTAVTGSRIGSMMAPSLLDLPDGRVVALGSGGSERIRSAMLSVLVGLVDRGEHADGAVEAPRIHWDGSGVQAEPPIDDDVVDALARLGPVTSWTGRHLYFGGAHVVVRYPDGRVEAHGDSRRGGASAVIDLP